ncbi:DinB family protein [Spiractinospora alimapuensis]|uniref:DinB family protein n=1 Tax=Spiractinospora alimapuensis TaxID=2820884 RepID=UPI001F3A229C|nr:DinB family protein [Spiractinospora alimapuensis]QVQ51199.1 DinB family protein [Spiractinospora alimapuensis]
MSTSRIDVLSRQLDIAWALFEHHLGQLHDDAFLWEPSPTSWSVRRDPEGIWVADWRVPEPDPVPTPTIAWLTWHMGYWWETTLGHCFRRDAVPERQEITWPGSAAAATEWLRGLYREWRENLDALSDDELDARDGTADLPWGRDETLVNVLAWLNVELTKNVAEIGMIHLLYLARTHDATGTSST